MRIEKLYFETRKMKFFNASQIFSFMVVLYLKQETAKSFSDIEVFSDDTTPAFNHLVIHSDNKTVFIGAVNRLYKLSLDLNLQDNVTTTSYPNPMNYSGILVTDKWDRKLIACGCSAEFVCKIFQINHGTSKLREISQNELPKLTENNTCASTTAFISDKTQTENDNGHQKLYFTSSYLRYESKQPAIAVRAFDSNSVLDQNSSVYNSDQSINNYRNLHHVKYVYGFESGRYKYFLTTQRDSTAQGSLNVSKLIRICHNGKDPLLQGYTEIPIECKSSGDRVKYNMVRTATIGKPSFQMAKSLNIRLEDGVLFGVFSKDRKMNLSSNELGNHSALCIYSINAIDEKFNENIQNCFNGIESRGFESKSPNPLPSCIENNRKIDSHFCTSQINMPLMGSTPISASSIISFNNLSTAIATKPSGNQTDVFIGTKTGHLKMIILQDVWHACDDADLVIDEGFSVKSDLLFSPQQESLYVMTKRKLTRMKLKLLDCSSHTSYAKCLNSNNQFCGWCGATNACTRRCNCSPQTEIVEKSSEYFQIGASELLHLYIPSFHSIGAGVSINCVFIVDNNNLMAYGNSSRGDYYNIHCPIPKYSEIAPIQKEKDYLNVTLIIYAARYWSSADTKLIFFNCKNYKFREACVSSKFECQWHLQDEKCTYNGKNITKNASIISKNTCCKNAENKPNRSFRNPAELPNHTLFSATNSLGECPNLANSCISCMDLDTKHSCGWCQSTKTCESRANCSGSWMENHYSCLGITSPSISSFRPQSGPREGGTIITIEGENLFYKFDDKDINQRIIVAGIACTPLQNMYVSMKSIACEIEKTNSSSAQTGPVVLHLNGTSIKSTEIFKFVDIIITDIFPEEGPLYGGTPLVLTGENLNVGRLVEVVVGNSSCLVFSRNSSTIQCITSASLLRNESKIFVKLDGNIHNSTNISFSYVKDPERDENGFNLEPKGIPAGNIKILIRDVNLTSTQQVLLHIQHGNRIYNSSCSISNKSNKTWTCLSPIIPDIDSSSLDAKNPVQMNASLSNAASNGSYLSSENLPFKFLLYPNPEFHYFLSSSIEFDDNNYVVIVGKNINKTCQKTDIKVDVGSTTCEVRSISSTQLICSLPKYSSLNDSNDNDAEEKFDILAKHDTITVSIGANFSVKVRKQFTSPPEKSNTNPFIPITLLFMIFIFVAILFIVAIAIFCLSSKKRATNYLKTVKELQQQVNVMGMDAIATKQCMKRVIIKNQISLDENSSKILKLPGVEIENTQILRSSNEILQKSEYILPYDDKWEFPKNNLTLGKSLGEGEFGKVIQGEAKNILKENITITVAVKMLKDDHSDEDMIDLVSEMEMMKLIGTHRNVLRLLGCCTKDGTLFVITEYARYGNLREFLRKHLSSENDVRTVSLSQKDLIAFAVQVAKGMKYLASKKCVHRDLAARNILVSDNYVLKIADFGLARDITNKDYYRKRTDGRLPVKWMAPESLCHSIYSTQSDVWSYGILLWEIFTLGGTPYPSFLEVEKLYQALQSGFRMEKPPSCSVEIYNLMQKCWCFQSNDRPSFSTILKNLKDILLSSEALERCNKYWLEKNESSDTEEECDRLLE